MVSISLQIVTVEASPKYRAKHVSLESTTNAPETAKNGLSGSTVTLLIAEPASARPRTSRKLAGMQSNRRAEQAANAEWPTKESRDPGSNKNLESF
jgi:hypothetical protein